VNTPSQYTCMNAKQYANTFTGAFRGRPRSLEGFLNQDYHGRFTRSTRRGDDPARRVPGQLRQLTSREPHGAQYSDDYHTGGFVASDEFALGRTTFPSWLPSSLRQAHYSWTNSVSNGQFNLGTNSFFVKDGWTPSLKFSAFVNLLWLTAFAGDGASPNSNRVWRSCSAPTPATSSGLPAGSAYRSRTPSSLLGPSSFGARGELESECGRRTQRVGSSANPTLVPETGTDIDPLVRASVHAHHSSRPTSTMANEAGALLNGNVVMTPAFAHWPLPDISRLSEP